MNKLWNDEYGFEVNKFLKGLAKFLFGAAVVIVGLGTIIGLLSFMDFMYWYSNHWYLPIVGGVIIAFICFLGAVNLLWLATLGNNVAIIRQQQEKGEQ